jgi:hypothetical protein
MSARACAERRIMLSLTQQQLAELIWVAYQQAHKYESGPNRMAANVAVGGEAPAAPVCGAGEELHDLGPRHQRAICTLARMLSDAPVVRRSGG